MFKFKHSKPQDCHRPLLCQACEQSPAAFLCKADDASLCPSCDSDIHSANPLARRHHRIPIHPSSMDGRHHHHHHHDFMTCNDDGDHDRRQADEDEAASWLLPNPPKNNNNNSTTMEMLFGGVVDDYLDLEDYNTCQFVGSNQFGSSVLQGQGQQQQRCYSNNSSCAPHQKEGCPGEDSVVPIQGNRGKFHQVLDHGFHLGLDYDNSSAGYSFSTTTTTTTTSISQNVSISSTDMGIVPESETNETLMPHQRAPKGTIDLFSGCHVEMPIQLSAEDREAKVLRYREKKKMRKFEKKIRYASRKAYAEIRPRIKGRFAKRTTTTDGGGGGGGVAGEDRILSQSGMSENAYGIVPSLF